VYPSDDILHRPVVPSASTSEYLSSSRKMALTRQILISGINSLTAERDKLFKEFQDEPTRLNAIIVYAKLKLTLQSMHSLEHLLDEWCDEGQHCDDWGCPLKHDPSTVQCAAGQYCLKGVVCRLKHDPSTVQCTRGINCDLRWCKLLHPKVDCPDGTACTKNWCKRYHNYPRLSAVEPE